MRKIDMENWKRKQHFDFFKKFDYPQFNISVDIDITNFKNYLDENNLSFFKSMVFLVTKNANQIEEFKYRIIDENQVVILDKVNPSFTIMAENNLFSFCNSEYHADREQFFKSMQASIEEYKENPRISDQANPLKAIYLTSLPWISFNSITHPIDIKNVDSNPRISWGKYYEEDEKIMLPFSVQVHHALMDGYHASKFINNLKEMFDQPQNILK